MKETLQKKPRLIITTKYRDISNPKYKNSVANQLTDYSYKFKNAYFVY